MYLKKLFKTIKHYFKKGLFATTTIATPTDKLLWGGQEVEIEESLCYLGQSDPSVVGKNIAKTAIWFLGPIIFLIISMRHATKLNNKYFTVEYAGYSIMRTNIILSIILSVLYLIIAAILQNFYSVEYLDTSTNLFIFSLEESFPLFLYLIIANSIVAGVVYLISTFRATNKKSFLLLAISSLLVLPVFLMFIRVLICKSFPSLNKYLPKDSIKFKKNNLKDMVNKNIDNVLNKK